MNFKNNLIKGFIPIISILLALLTGALLIALIGGNPKLAFEYLLKGAFGSKNNIGETLVKATPLIFTSLAAAFAYKCGVFNLGGQGQFVMGAVASALVATTQNSLEGLPLIIVSLTAGAIAGGLWGMIPGILKITRGLNELIVSIMMNYIAILFMGYLYTAPLRDGSVPQTAAVRANLSRLMEGPRTHTGIIIAVVLALVVYYFMFHTSAGFKLRAVGMNQTASFYNGFPVKRLMLIAFVVSGAIAGLGGSVELHGTQNRLMSGFGDGYGFDGVAIALIAQLNPIGSVIVAYLFAVLRTGAMTMQVGTGLPTAVIDIIQALIIVFAVAGSALTNMPKIRQYILKLSLIGSKEEA
jgi:simple sugar transport system permease protein